MASRRQSWIRTPLLVFDGRARRRHAHGTTYQQIFQTKKTSPNVPGGGALRSGGAARLHGTAREHRSNSISSWSLVCDEVGFATAVIVNTTRIGNTLYARGVRIYVSSCRTREVACSRHCHSTERNRLRCSFTSVLSFGMIRFPLFHLTRSVAHIRVASMNEQSPSAITPNIPSQLRQHPPREPVSHTFPLIRNSLSL